MRTGCVCVCMMGGCAIICFQEHDEPILQHLRDIKVRFTESEPLVSFEMHMQENSAGRML